METFVGFPKIPRYSRECVITEKIDGTNGCIFIREAEEFLVGSRSRWISPGKEDNHSFAAWAMAHREELLKLGPGQHFGEWWGQGINRGYGLKEKRFSLFNIHKWNDPALRPACCHVVPVLWTGNFDMIPLWAILDKLKKGGSVAAPGFMNPEGVVLYHIQGNVSFKKTILKDEEPKGGYGKREESL